MDIITPVNNWHANLDTLAYSYTAEEDDFMLIALNLHNPNYTNFAPEDPLEVRLRRADGVDDWQTISNNAAKGWGQAHIETLAGGGVNGSQVYNGHQDWVL